MAYYDRLLGKASKTKQKSAMIADEANPHERLINVPMHIDKLDDDDGGLTFFPALLDRQEGDPEPGEADEEVIPKRRLQLCDKEINDVEAITDFLLFTFVRSQRVIQKGPRSGSVSWSWQATCLFHKDEFDKEGTHCTRAMTFHGPEDEKQCILRLKMWCIKGRAARSRAIMPDGHKFTPVVDDKLLSNKVLRRQLKEGLAASSWIDAGAAEAEIQNPSDSSDSL